MKPHRTLAVHRERLADLQAADLREVVGGTHIRTDCCPHTSYGLTCGCPTEPLDDCIDRLFGQTG